MRRLIDIDFAALRYEQRSDEQSGSDIAGQLIKAAAAPVDAATILPGIGGNVFLDGSSDPISGVTLKLFRIKIGVFDPAIDPMAVVFRPTPRILCL